MLAQELRGIKMVLEKRKFIIHLEVLIITAKQKNGIRMVNVNKKEALDKKGAFIKNGMKMDN